MAPRHERRESAVAQQTIRLYLAEEQQILREAYLSFFRTQPTIELLGSSSDTSGESLAAALKPNVMLVGLKTLEPATVERLQWVRAAGPNVGLILLFAFYDVGGIRALREFSASGSGGFGYLLKHTIDTAEQLTQVVHAVAEGRIIIDPMAMGGLIGTGDEQNSFLMELSPKELEVLSWMAKGYRNETIADVLSRDAKTVERHINSIYSTLQHSTVHDPDSSKHPRVRAALMYLKATGLLPSEHIDE